MERETFDYLWDECIEKAAIEILRYYPSEYGNRWDWIFDNSEKVKTAIYNQYDYYKSIIHQKYFQGKRIDVHKIASCICAAIIDIAPMSCSYLKNTPWLIGISNYVLAFNSSIYIVHLFLYEEYDETNKEFAKAMERSQRFSFPPTTSGHDYYAKGRVKALALNHHYKKDFDILGYADMLYWIEYYNRQIIENRIILH